VQKRQGESLPFCFAEADPMTLPARNPPRPAISVAAVVARDGRYLLVEERVRGGVKLNQPAGHLEAGETLVAGAVRETLEESGWQVDPTHIVGIYRWQPRDGARAYLRFAFAAEARAHDAARRLDDGIVRALWMTPRELRECPARHRSPLVMRCVDDHLAGRRLPLDWIAEVGSGQMSGQTSAR
jgi:8-oxo-dGTP pyrophosphatase MutT (NUDIX family)